jgi:hypothetical protein
MILADAEGQLEAVGARQAEVEGYRPALSWAVRMSVRHWCRESYRVF